MAEKEKQEEGEEFRHGCSRANPDDEEANEDEHARLNDGWARFVWSWSLIRHSDFDIRT
jgi:hypothetical protein